MLRRSFFAGIMAGSALVRDSRAQTAPAPGQVLLERPVSGQPHKGKVLLAIQAHSDDIPLSASGTIAKLIQEGYTGYMVRATNDDMGDAPGLGTPGSIGENVLRNEQDNLEIVRILGLNGNFDLNYPNHRMADTSINELICRLIFLIRCLKVDTVIAHDPWAHGEENPDHYTLARGVEAACWMAGRTHDYPEQFAAGLKPYAVREKYYYARRPAITRVVDISGVVDKKIEANRANRAKGPAGRQGSKLRAELAAKGLRLPVLGDDEVAADRNYIREFQLARNRELGKQYGVEYAEAFHYIGPGGRRGREEYIKENAVPLRK